MFGLKTAHLLERLGWKVINIRYFDWMTAKKKARENDIVTCNVKQYRKSKLSERVTGTTIIDTRWRVAVLMSLSVAAMGACL
jgi:hypothetical protein